MAVASVGASESNPSFHLIPTLDPDPLFNTPIPGVQLGGWVAVDEGNDVIFAFSDLDGEVAVIDGRTNAVIHDFSVGKTSILALANPVSHRLYVSHHQENEVTVVDVANPLLPNSVKVVPVSDLFDLPEGGLAVDPIRNRVYVANPGPGTITVLDEAEDQVRTLAIGGHPSFVAVNEQHGLLYVIGADPSGILVLDEANEEVVDLIPLPTTAGISFLAVDPVENQLYLTRFLSPQENLLIVDGDSKQVQSLTLETQPLTVSVNPGAGRVYVVAHDPARAWVLDAETHTVLDTVALNYLGDEQEADFNCIERHYVDGNPLTGRLYLPCGQLSTIATLVDCEVADGPPCRPDA